MDNAIANARGYQRNPTFGILGFALGDLVGISFQIRTCVVLRDEAVVGGLNIDEGVEDAARQGEQRRWNFEPECDSRGANGQDGIWRARR